MKYKITVESLDTKKFVEFETENHDDLFKIFDTALETNNFAKDETLSLILGLKLFSEVMLKRKDFSPFELLRPHFGAFMKSFKDSMKSG